MAASLRPDTLVCGPRAEGQLFFAQRGTKQGSIWVVQDVNVDGHAAKRQKNARGVGLKVAVRLIRRLHPDVTIWFDQARALGADRIVDYTKEDFTKSASVTT